MTDTETEILTSDYEIMKALLIESNNGLQYEDFDHWISAVFLVPDDFDCLKIKNQIIEKAAAQNLIRITKNGDLFSQDRSKINELYNNYLKNNFKELEILH